MALVMGVATRAAAWQEPTLGEQETVLEVVAARLHLRAEPALNGLSRGLAPRRTLVCVLQREEGWVRVRVTLRGRRVVGWMARGFLAEPEPPVRGETVSRICGTGSSGGPPESGLAMPWGVTR